MMGSNVARLMSDHHSRTVLTSAERMDPARARIGRAMADPIFAARVTKAVSRLRQLGTGHGRSLAGQFTDAVQLAQATGAALPTVLENAGLLRRIF